VPFGRQQALTVLCDVFSPDSMKFWLIFILIFFAVRYLLPIVLRLALNSFVRKQMHNGGFAVPPQARPDSGPAHTRPGEVRVDYVPPTAAQPGKQQGFTGGEYVDFEEVK
jgi:hypothetical protein